MPFNGQGPDIMWKVMDPENAPALMQIGLIPRGIMHIYTFSPDGTIAYRSVEIKPSPYTCIGENQLYGEILEGQYVGSSVAPWLFKGVKYPDSLGNLQTGTITGLPRYDVYVRDLARNLGSKTGGQHGGDRLDGNPEISFSRNRRHDFPIPTVYGDVNNLVIGSVDFGAGGRAGGHGGHSGGHHGSSGHHGGHHNGHSNGHGNGNANGHHHGSSQSSTAITGSGEGIPPMISRQDDFASSNIPVPEYVSYTYGPAGGAPRPAYTKNGLCADIRFRRQLDAGDLDFLIGGHDLGYVGEMF